MTETDLLAPFDLAVIRTTAQHNTVDEATLREALTAHQRTMRETPGVEELVYEWRRQYDDPVLVRTPDVFVLAGPRNLRNMHLKTLSALAQIVQEEEFERHWLAAADTEALRDVLLLGRRLRGPAAGPGPGETLASTVAASNHTNGSERRYQ